MLNEKGVSTVDELSEKDKASIVYWETRNSPFKGVEDYFSPIGISVGGKRVYNFMSYNLSVPRKVRAKANIVNNAYEYHNTTEATNYYDNKYAQIEANPILKDFYNLMSEVTKTIKESLPYELQEKMSVNSLPALKKNIIEILSDKDTPFYKGISLAAKQLYDKIVTGLGIVKQNPNSTSNVDVITNLPDYRVNTNFLEGNAKEILRQQILLTSKFLSAYNQDKSDEEKLKKITRFSVLNLDSFNAEALNVIAEMLGVEPTISTVKSITGEVVNIGRIIKDSATHAVVQQQSFDLPKIAKYYSHLAMEYSARQDILPLMQIMKSHYEEIKAPATTNAHESINNVGSGNTRFTGLRDRANSQMEDWFNRVALNNYETKHVGVKEAVDTVLPKTAKEKLQYAINTVMGKNTNKKLYTIKEKELINEIDAAIEKEEDADRRKTLMSLKDDLGRNFSGTAMLDSFLDFVRLKGLGWNVSSQVTNLIEGTVSNMIVASTGDYFEPHLIYEGYHVVKGSFLKSVTGNKIQTKGAKKARILMDRYRVLQDSSNELQKASTRTNFSWTRNLNPYELTRRVEYLNQTPLMIAMLKDKKITGKDGVESTVWDSMDENGKLKDNFATEDNVANWENADGQTYKDLKTTLTKAIVVAHGNYDDKRGMMAKSSSLGKAMLMFKTWVTSGIYQRIGTEQDDLESGIKSYKGRYWSFTPGSATTFGAVAGFMTLGPLGSVITGATGFALANIWGKKSDMGFLKEMVYTNKLLFKKMLGMPINIAFGKNIINSNGDFEKMIGSGNFDERDAKNLRANMADMALILTWIVMFLLSKSFFYDDDDKPSDPRRQKHNLLVNRFMQLADQATMFVNPVSLKDNLIGNIAIFKFFEDLGKEVGELVDYMQGDDIIKTGVNAGESALYNQTMKTFVPGIFKDNSFGFEAQMERQFKPSKMDKYFKSDEKLKEEEVKGDRAERRAELEEAGKTDKEIRKILDKELPTPKQLKRKQHKK